MKLPLTALHLDYHIPELSIPAFAHFDFDHYLEMLLLSDAEIVTLFAKDHFGNSFYETHSGYQHRDLPRDLLADALPALHKKGKKVLAYYSLCWEKRAAEEHPEWCQRDYEGNPLVAGGPWGAVCVNSPYMEELVLPQLREIVGNYPVDGIFIDIAMLTPGGCYCEYCRKEFEQHHGEALQPGEKQLVFAAESMRRAMLKIREAAGDRLLCANASWGVGQPRELEDIVDFLVVESQPAHVSSGGYLLQLIQAKYCHAAGKPFQIITVRFHGGGWGELSLKPAEQLRYEFSLIAAHGGRICCGDQGDYDGNLDDQTHRELGKAFEFLREREPFFGGRARRHIAVLWDNGGFPFSVDELPPELPGMTKLLSELNQQYEFCSFRTFLREPEAYAGIFLPAGITVTEEVECALKNFAASGGVVIREPEKIAPGHCYLEDEDGKILLKTGCIPLSAAEGEVLHHIYSPLVPYAPPENPWRSPYTPAGRDPQPGIVRRPVGKGCEIQLAAALSRAYWLSNDSRIAGLFRSLLEDAHLDSPVTVSLPGFDVNLVDQEKRELLHLVRYNAGRNAMNGYPAIAPHEPVSCHVSIRSMRCPEKINLQPEGEALPFAWSKGVVHLTVPVNSLYEIVELYY